MAGNHEELQDSVKELKETLSCLLKKIEDCSKEMLAIADDLDNFHRGATIASVTGSSVGIAGGVTTIVGLALAPFTLGASLIVSGVGMGVAVAGGITASGASIADSVNIKNKSSKVEKIVNEVNMEINTLEKASNKLDSLVKALESEQNVMEQIPDAARYVGKGVFAAVEVARIIKLGEISAAAAQGAQLAVRGAQVIKVVSGVFAAVFIVIDAAFLVKGVLELQDGSKTETATKIRECAEEFKKLRQDLQKLDENLVALNETKLSSIFGKI